jgi:hypothetical protein
MENAVRTGSESCYKAHPSMLTLFFFTMEFGGNSTNGIFSPLLEIFKYNV